MQLPDTIEQDEYRRDYSAWPAKPPLVHGSYLNPSGQVEVYEHAFFVRPVPRMRPSDPPEPPKRGAVNSFSRASRRRLIKTFMRLQSSLLHAPYFVTLTFHHWEESERRPPHEYLNIFLTDLKRNYPTSLYLWRLELQRRGAPHYHLIIWFPAGEAEPDDDDFRSYVRDAWHRIADPDSQDHKKHGTRVDRAESYRRAFLYVCKYTAKSGSHDDTGYPGRRWARSRSLPTDPVSSFEITDKAAHYLKRILRKLVNKRAGKVTPISRHMKRPQSCIIRLDVDEAYQLLDCLARSGPIPLPGFDPIEHIDRWAGVLDRRKQDRHTAFRRFTLAERSAIAAALPGQETPGQGVPS